MGCTRHPCTREQTILCITHQGHRYSIYPPEEGEELVLTIKHFLGRTHRCTRFLLRRSVVSSDAAMNKQQGCCTHSLMKAEMSFTLLLVLLESVSVSSRYIMRCRQSDAHVARRTVNIRCDTSKIEGTSTSASLCYCCCIVPLSHHRYDLFHGQQYGSRIEAILNHN